LRHGFYTTAPVAGVTAGSMSACPSRSEHIELKYFYRVQRRVQTAPLHSRDAICASPCQSPRRLRDRFSPPFYRHFIALLSPLYSRSIAILQPVCDRSNRLSNATRKWRSTLVKAQATTAQATTAQAACQKRLRPPRAGAAKTQADRAQVVPAKGALKSPFEGGLGPQTGHKGHKGRVKPDPKTAKTGGLMPLVGEGAGRGRPRSGSAVRFRGPRLALHRTRAFTIAMGAAHRALPFVSMNSS